jgi:hypothetical protein
VHLAQRDTTFVLVSRALLEAYDLLDMTPKAVKKTS